MPWSLGLKFLIRVVRVKVDRDPAEQIIKGVIWHTLFGIVATAAFGRQFNQLHAKHIPQTLLRLLENRIKYLWCDAPHN